MMYNYSVKILFSKSVISSKWKGGSNPANSSFILSTSPGPQTIAECVWFGQETESW